MSAYLVTVGLPYEALAETVDLEGGSNRGTSQGMHQKIYEIDVDLWCTNMIEVGTNLPSPYFKTWRHFQTLDMSTFDYTTVPIDQPLTLRSGLVRSWPLEKGDFYGNSLRTAIAFRHKEPLPCGVRALITRTNAEVGQ